MLSLRERSFDWKNAVYTTYFEFDKGFRSCLQLRWLSSTSCDWLLSLIGSSELTLDVEARHPFKIADRRPLRLILTKIMIRHAIKPSHGWRLWCFFFIFFVPLNMNMLQFLLKVLQPVLNGVNWLLVLFFIIGKTPIAGIFGI